jgi:hypothetical protein
MTHQETSAAWYEQTARLIMGANEFDMKCKITAKKKLNPQP